VYSDGLTAVTHAAGGVVCAGVPRYDLNGRFYLSHGNPAVAGPAELCDNVVHRIRNVALADMNACTCGGPVRDILSGFIIRDLAFSVYRTTRFKLQKDLKRPSCPPIEAVDVARGTLHACAARQRAQRGSEG